MGKPSGFLEFKREVNQKVPVSKRIQNFDEFYIYNSEAERKQQASRCMNCGVPFCSSNIELSGMITGCPLHNLIPEWNDEIYHSNYSHALSRLLKTSPFPEFTGRVCPALCEKACINGMNSEAVTIHDNELFLIENAFKNSLIQPNAPKIRSNKTIAIIGSGPAGLAVAEKLNKRGHNVCVYERDDRVGGLLMYGIPNMKLDKSVIDRRINIMKQEGVEFITNANLGVNLSIEDLEKKYDAIVLCCGAKKARDITVDKKDSDGIYFAVDFLTSTTKALLKNGLKSDYINAKDKDVVIIGGGDTGNDCVGTSIRHGAKSVHQLEIMPEPPTCRAENNPWPEWPKVKLTDYGQQEAIEVFGADPRVYKTTIKEIYQENGVLTGVLSVQVEFKNNQFVEIAGSEKLLPADLLLIAAGFIGYEDYICPNLHIPTKEDLCYNTNKENIFACGDMKRGQSLVVWAIADGIKCAKEVDTFLMGY